MKLLLAGAETAHDRALLREYGVRHVAIHYGLLRKRLNSRRETVDALREDLSEFETVYVDSGWRGYDGTDVGRYLDDYYALLHELKDVVQFYGAFRFPEASITHSWRREAIRQGLTDISAPVNEIDSQSYLGQVAEDCRFGSIYLTNPRRPAMPPANAIMTLRRRGLDIHGAGITAPKYLNSYPFYAASSNSWLGGRRFGTLYVYRPGRVQAYSEDRRPTVLSSLLPLCEKHGIDFDALRAGDNNELSRVNLVAWAELADYHERRN